MVKTVEEELWELFDTFLKKFEGRDELVQKIREKVPNFETLSKVTASFMLPYYTPAISGTGCSGSRCEYFNIEGFTEFMFDLYGEKFEYTPKEQGTVKEYCRYFCRGYLKLNKTLRCTVFWLHRNNNMLPICRSGFDSRREDYPHVV